jgi:hypothetical protein
MSALFALRLKLEVKSTKGNPVIPRFEVGKHPCTTVPLRFAPHTGFSLINWNRESHTSQSKDRQARLLLSRQRLVLHGAQQQALEVPLPELLLCDYPTL